MATPQDFASSCRATAKQLRRLPADLRRELGAQVQTRVADPEAARVAGTFTGPWARHLSAGTKSRKLADPTIIVGGARKVVGGRASVRDLVFGAQWGGGSRVNTVTRRKKHGGTVSFRKHTTRQFAGRGPATIIRTLDADAGRILQAWAGIVDEVLGEVGDG